ncbi:GNAT family N-acetyltransferase [Streptomyces sp. NPDC002677]|uniref:GNAT family N-acetyltransferase n=1 Tax=Streptomyces sp. NPDC002677 TaxID=3154774 RepID=UPI00331F6138
MPPTDASADAGPVPVHPAHPGRSGPAEDTRDCEDTLDLRLPAELLALFTGKATGPDPAGATHPDVGGTPGPDNGRGGLPAPPAPDGPDTAPTTEAQAPALDLDRPVAPAHERAAALDDERAAALSHEQPPPRAPFRPTAHTSDGPLPQAPVRQTAHASDGPPPHAPGRPTHLHHDPLGPLGTLGPLDTLDLLDQLATWGPTSTPVGVFHLVPVHVERDLPIISRWMNDPAVAAFWQLAGSRAQTEDYLHAQLAGDGRSVPCLGRLDGTPMSYWEIYRADLDPLARHYPARPHDTGVHLLIGDAADRGRGLGSALLRAAADLVLDHRPACARVVAEPDLHNTPSVAAFLGAGFRYAAEVDLPAKRAALMIRDRSLRHLM